MTIIKRAMIIGATVVCGALAASGAEAAYVVNFSQVGGDVVAEGSGSFDFLQSSFIGFLNPMVLGVNPSSGFLGVGNEDNYGNPESYGDQYASITGPASFGSGGFTAATSTTGTVSGIDAGGGYFIVSGGYSSGQTVTSSTTTWQGATFSSLGLTSGTYVWTLGTSSDTFTINVPGSDAPEPASWAMMLAGFGLVGAAMRSRRKVALSFG